MGNEVSQKEIKRVPTRPSMSYITYLFWHTCNHCSLYQRFSPFYIIQCAPLATDPGISLIILTPMKILQRNLNRSTFVVWEMKRNVSVVCVCSAPNCCNILISGKIIKEMPGSVASGTHGVINIVHLAGEIKLITLYSPSVYKVTWRYK